MAPKGTELRWGVEQRLEFIEFRLFWEGGINRADITGFFGVSVPQASKDLSQYQELAPHNLRYDRSEKRYFAAPTFKPLYLKPDADRYLTELARSAEPAAHGEQSWLLAPPSIDTLPLPHRRVETSVLRPLLEAIREERAVEIFYQSMNNQQSHHMLLEVTDCVGMCGRIATSNGSSKTIFFLAVSRSVLLMKKELGKKMTKGGMSSST